MTDTENTLVCRAQLVVLNGGPWNCILSEGHAGPHKDDDQDTWDIHYRDAPRTAAPLTEERVNEAMTVLERRVLAQLSRLSARVDKFGDPVYTAPADERDGNYLHGRRHDDLIKELFQRLSKLEAAWTVGGETLSERLDRVFLGTLGEVRTVAGRVSRLEPLVQLSGRSETGVVLLDPEQYTALLKDREELQAVRNAAQAVPGTDLLGLLRDRAQAAYPGDIEAWRKAADKLGALEAAGVDNWEGYSHAMSIYRGEEDD